MVFVLGALSFWKKRLGEGRKGNKGELWNGVKVLLIFVDIYKTRQIFFFTRIRNSGAIGQMHRKALTALLTVVVLILAVSFPPMVGVGAEASGVYPVVNGISPGTVPENYDRGQTIYIRGDSFREDTIRIYFNDEPAQSVKVSSDGTGLTVELPVGSRRLAPGLYNVTVANDDDHVRIWYGAFSVVPEGRNVPDEQYRVQEIAKGTVWKNTKASEDTLQLDADYRDRSHLWLDLDDLMGEDVRVREIRFTGSRYDTIGELETTSKWADITLFDLTLADHSDDREITIRLGRTEPGLAEMLKRSLGDIRLRSEFIQATGENFAVSGLTLFIPLKNSAGDLVQVLRYDESDRKWHKETSFLVDKMENIIQISAKEPGIFVVTEQGGER